MSANPIAHMELRHQRYVIKSSRSGWVWIGLALLFLIPALLMAVVTFVAVMFDLPLPSGGDINQMDSPGTLLVTIGSAALMTMNVAQYVVVTMISYGLAANSITREKRGNTWDNLLLTNVNARTIVRGKFRASLRALSGDYLIVAVLRVGLLALLIPFIQTFTQILGSSPPVASRLDVLLLAAVIVAYTLLEAVMNTALSLMTMLLAVPGAVANTLFLLLRTIAAVAGVWWLVETVRTAFEVPWMAYLLLGLVGLAVYALLSWAALRLAEVAAVVGSQATPVAQAPPR